MIVQTNIWICENVKCEKTESTTEETSMYDDPVVRPPKGREWGISSKEDKMFCPECLEEESK